MSHLPSVTAVMEYTQLLQRGRVWLRNCPLILPSDAILRANPRLCKTRALFKTQGRARVPTVQVIVFKSAAHTVRNGTVWRFVNTTREHIIHVKFSVVIHNTFFVTFFKVFLYVFLLSCSLMCQSN